MDGGFLSAEPDILENMLQLVFSLVAGGAIGFERERKNQGAGLRTHILISLGATLLMILSAAMTSGDPGRIGAQVVTGIGFIGAGTIMRYGGNVRGLTTAASIWISAALGLVIGGGLYVLAAIGLLLALFTLIVLARVERRVFTDRSYKTLEINIRGTKISTDAVMPMLEEHAISVSNVDVAQDVSKKTVKMRFLIKIPDGVDIQALYQELNTIKSVYQVKLQQPT